MNASPPTPDELSAFVDGELDEQRMAEVARYLASDPALADHVSKMRSDMALLAATFRPVKDAPLPAAWVDMIERSSGTRLPRRRFLHAGAALAASLLAAGGAWELWRVVDRDHDEPIVAEALDARSGTIAHGRSLTGADLSDVALRDRAVAQTLSLDVKVPDLTRLGYRLAGVQIYGGIRPNGRFNSPMSTGRTEASPFIFGVPPARRASI